VADIAFILRQSTVSRVVRYRDNRMNKPVARESAVIDESRIVKLESDVHRLQSDVTEIKGDVKSLKTEFQTQFGTLKTEFLTFKAEVAKEFGSIRTSIERAKLWM